MFGEAGIKKDSKKGKVLNRGLTMVCVGYSEDHVENVFRLFNPETSRIAQSRNVIWLGRQSPSAFMMHLLMQRFKSLNLQCFISLKKGG
jgi:hypothetical protein